MDSKKETPQEREDRLDREDQLDRKDWDANREHHERRTLERERRRIEKLVEEHKLN